MFIIPTGLLREKSIATMISTVDKKFIESILNREFEFYKFNFKPSTWQDAFIIELLKYYVSNYYTKVLSNTKLFLQLYIHISISIV